jgi:hypothetical protein
MASNLVILSAAAAAAALWLGALGQASALRRLREELDEVRRPPAPPSRSRGRSSRPMFSGLYQTEQTSFWAKLQAVPGGMALAAAATLAAVAVALTLWGPAEAPSRPEVPAVELTAIQASVDSVSQALSQLRDSLRLAAEQSAAVPAQPGRTTLARRQGTAAGAVPPARPLPSAPKLDSALVPR